MADLATIGQNVLTVGLGAAASFFASIKQTKATVLRLQRELRALSEDAVRQSSIDVWKDSIVKGMRLELESIKSDVAQRMSQAERISDNTGSSQVAFNRRIEQLEQDITRLENKEFVSRSEFNDFVREQTKTCMDQNRILGEIRGMMSRR